MTGGNVQIHDTFFHAVIDTPRRRRRRVRFDVDRRSFMSADVLSVCRRLPHAVIEQKPEAAIIRARRWEQALMKNAFTCPPPSVHRMNGVERLCLTRKKQHI
jgi:hypothetical protein